MMASTMAIPHMTPLPNFPGPPMPGTIPGGMHGPMSGGYPGHIPVSMPTGPIMTGPMTNGTNTPANISPPIQTLRLPVVPVGGGCYNDFEKHPNRMLHAFGWMVCGMEVVWHGEFSRLFSSFFPPHVWYLSITNSAPQEKWKYCRDSAKVRFCCQDCGNGWTSMKGRVTFWFHLNMATNEGFVQFKLYGQVCKKCNSGKFEYVMWYPEEVSKVMCNLYNKVGQTYYGFMQPPIRIDRRPGRPRNQHNAELCQACRDGECDQGRPVKAMFNYLQPGMNNPQPNHTMPPRPQMPPQSLPQVMHPQLPVVIRQPPPMPPPRHIVMHPHVNMSNTSMPVSVVQVSSSGTPLITAPVTLTSGAQPILTYSIVTGTMNEAPKLPTLPESIKSGSPTLAASSTNDDKVSSASQALYTLRSAAPTYTVPAKTATVFIKAPKVNGTSTEILDKSEKSVKSDVTVPPQISLAKFTPKITLTNDKNAALKTTKGKEAPISPKKAQATITNGYAAAAASGKAALKPKVLPLNGITAV